MTNRPLDPDWMAVGPDNELVPRPKDVPDTEDNPAFAQSFDAMDWDKAFCQRFSVTRNEDGEPMDEGLMVGWFANAIMRGWDEHARRYGGP
jgi:hypothetical protein